MNLPSPPDDSRSGSRQPAAGTLGLGDILEIGIRLIRRHWLTLLLIALVFQAPAAILTSAAGIGLADTLLDVVPGLAEGQLPAQPILSDPDLERLLASAGLLLAASALAGVLGAVATLAYARVVAADHAGLRTSLGEAAGVALRRTPVTLAIVLVTSLLIVALTLVAGLLMAGLLLLAPPDPRGGGGAGVFASLVVGVALVFTVVYLSLRWAVALPSAALEPGGPRRALSRSWHLVASNMWRTAFILVMGALVTSVLGSVITQLASLALSAPLPDRSDAHVARELLASVLAATLTAPFAPVLVGILYHDLRARLDGPAALRSTARFDGAGDT